MGHMWFSRCVKKTEWRKKGPVFVRAHVLWMLRKLLSRLMNRLMSQEVTCLQCLLHQIKPRIEHQESLNRAWSYSSMAWCGGTDFLVHDEDVHNSKWVKIDYWAMLIFIFSDLINLATSMDQNMFNSHNNLECSHVQGRTILSIWVSVDIFSQSHFNIYLTSIASNVLVLVSCPFVQAT